MMARAGTRRLVVLASISAAWVLLSCVPALAHANLVRAEPAEGETLTESPDRVELRFSEPVEAEFTPLEVRDSEGNRVDQDDAGVAPDDARVVEATLEGGLPEGSYTVQWRVTSIDGHVVEGQYEFALSGAADEQPAGGDRETQERRTGEGAGRAEEEQAAQNTPRDGSTRIVAYSVLSLGVLAAVAAGALLLGRLVRRNGQ